MPAEVKIVASLFGGLACLGLLFWFIHTWLWARIISHRKIEKKRAYAKAYYLLHKYGIKLKEGNDLEITKDGLKRGGQSEKSESTSEIPNV